jgi:hypothetical protein
MRYWSVQVPRDRYAAERLYRHDGLALAEPAADASGPSPGDFVALVADADDAAGSRVVFALGRVARRDRAPEAGDPDDPDADRPDGTLLVAYTRRLFDDPRPVPGPAEGDHPVTELSAADYARLTAAPAPARVWLVSLDLPIEAPTAAEAVRQFWSYVEDLGPRELPAFVSPSGNELAMQALVAGEPVNLDPEEE